MTMLKGLAYEAHGPTLFYLGEYTSARTHFEQGIALTDPAVQRALAGRQGEALGVHCLAVAANTMWCLGYPTQAVGRDRRPWPWRRRWPIPIV